MRPVHRHAARLAGCHPEAVQMSRGRCHPPARGRGAGPERGGVRRARQAGSASWGPGKPHSRLLLLGVWARLPAAGQRPRAASGESGRRARATSSCLRPWPGRDTAPPHRPWARTRHRGALLAGGRHARGLGHRATEPTPLRPPRRCRSGGADKAPGAASPRPPSTPQPARWGPPWPAFRTRPLAQAQLGRPDARPGSLVSRVPGLPGARPQRR